MRRESDPVVALAFALAYVCLVAFIASGIALLVTT